MKKLCTRLQILFLVIMFLIPAFGFSQYFGRNKPGYKTFKYDALHTPNFEIYHYLPSLTVNLLSRSVCRINIDFYFRFSESVVNTFAFGLQ